MKKDVAEQDYEFSYTDKDLFESGPGKEWCPLFGELPTIFVNRRKHQVADRCVDVIIAARNLWEIPYPYFSSGTFLTHEHLALSNPNWPDPDEIPGYQAAILAARSIVWWNHYHIVTNARDYCRNIYLSQHWHENDAGILHYARTSMNHFAYPLETDKTSIEKYERNISIQEEARKIPDYLVFAALAIAEAWGILTDVLYDGQRERSAYLQRDLEIANKFLEKAQRLKIKDVEDALSTTEKDLDVHEEVSIKREKKTRERIRKMAATKNANSKDVKDAVVDEATRIMEKDKSCKKYGVINLIRNRTLTGKLKNKQGKSISPKELPKDRTIDRWISHLFA